MMMIERMARATLEALEREAVYAQAVDGDLSKCMVDGGLFDMRTVMRAALTALLEPSEGMVASVITEPTHLYDDGSRGVEYQRGMKNAVMIERAVLASRFREMIQAALDEKEGV